MVWGGPGLSLGAGSGLAGSCPAAALSTCWRLAGALSARGDVVWALAILSLPFLLLLLTPGMKFPAARGRILTAVTISPCQASGLQDPKLQRR